MKLSLPIDLQTLFQFTTRERFDWISPACIAVLSLFGVFFIYSAQMTTDQQQWINQLVWLGLGAIIYVGT